MTQKEILAGIYAELSEIRKGIQELKNPVVNTTGDTPFGPRISNTEKVEEVEQPPVFDKGQYQEGNPAYGPFPTKPNWPCPDGRHWAHAIPGWVASK